MALKNFKWPTENDEGGQTWRIELCFIDGNIWPLKISNGPQKMLKADMALTTSDLGTTL